MALRLKRGTNAERLNYTPELGELIYVTDYSTENVSPLWIGDGSTVGGNEITGNGDTEVVSDTAPQLGGNLDLNGFNIVGNGDIDTNGNVDITGNLLAGSIAASSISGNFDGDLSGSVFGDDSTKIIDGVNNIIQAKLFQSSDNLVSFGNGSDVSSSIVSIQSTNQQGVLDLKRISESDLTGINTINYGMIRFSRDDVNGSGIKGIIVGRENAILFSSSSLGLFTDPTDYFSFKEKKFGIGTITPEETLDVNGNAIISGSLEADAILLSGSTIDTSDSSAINVVPATTFNSDVTVENNLTVTNTLTVDTLEVTNFQTAGNGTPELESDTDILLTAGTRVEVTQSPLAMASFTTTERNALTPQNGDVIYNTTDNKFQGYAGGTWINLH